MPCSAPPACEIWVGSPGCADASPLGTYAGASSAMTATNAVISAGHTPARRVENCASMIGPPFRQETREVLTTHFSLARHRDSVEEPTSVVDGDATVRLAPTARAANLA